jgi:hypothetical protein
MLTRTQQVWYMLTSLDTDKIFFCFTKAIKEKY